ncbi:hypothetical protein H4582DRAFT_2079519 [Lactarius indigo]|nr:hypothetical protein H4582DRAFT_2079519 [Lactarius indigo]
MLPIWRGGLSLLRLSPRLPRTHLSLSLIVHSILTSHHATPAHALLMHVTLDIEALDPIVELELAERVVTMPPTGGMTVWWTLYGE